MKPGSFIAVLGLAGLLAGAASPVQAEELFYYVDDGRVVITNTPSRADIRTVPGFSGRVMQAGVQG
jgi:hypothetical protein